MKKLTMIYPKGYSPPPKLYVPTRMLNKKQTLEILGVAPTSPIRKEIFDLLPTYDNRFNQHACYREEDVIELLRSLPPKSRDS